MMVATARYRHRNKKESIVWTLAHRRLQEAAIYLWPNARDCRVLVVESGMDASNLDFDEPPALRWQSVISEAEKQNAMQKLVPVMLARYPDNAQLKSACAPFAPAEPVSAAMPVEIPKPQVAPAEPIPIVPTGAVLVPKFDKAAPAPAVSVTPVPAGAVLVPEFEHDTANIPVVLEDSEAAATIASLRLVLKENERRLSELEEWRRQISALAQANLTRRNEI